MAKLAPKSIRFDTYNKSVSDFVQRIIHDGEATVPPRMNMDDVRKVMMTLNSGQKNVEAHFDGCRLVIKKVSNFFVRPVLRNSSIKPAKKS
jgi:hypothetical protein